MARQTRSSAKCFPLYWHTNHCKKNILLPFPIPHYWDQVFIHTQKLGIRFFIPILNPKVWELNFLFPFLIPKDGIWIFIPKPESWQEAWPFPIPNPNCAKVISAND